MNLPAWLLIALAAGFGGVAPNVFRLGADLQAGAPMPDPSYFIGVAVFFVVGAAVALAFEEDNAKKAFFLGLSLPAMFQSGVADATATGVASLLNPPTVYANEEPPKRVEVFYNYDAPDFTFIFSQQGTRRGREEAVLEDRGTDTEVPGIDHVVVPPWATNFQVLVVEDRQLSELQPVVDGPWEIEIVPAPLRGLKTSIGIKNAPRWRIKIGKREEGK